MTRARGILVGLPLGFVVSLSVWLFPGALGSAVARAEAPPANPALRQAIRIAVEPQGRAAAGQEMAIKVSLRDGKNQEARAVRPYEVAVLAQSPSGAAPVRMMAVIEAGQSEATVKVPAPLAGLLEIRATHPQLLDGGTFVRVGSAALAPRSERKLETIGSTGVSDLALGPAGAIGHGTLARETRMGALQGIGAGAGAEPHRTPHPTTSPAAEVISKHVGRPAPAPVLAPVLAPVAEPAAAPAGLPRLILRYSPQRKILADGKDSVTIQAFVESDLATVPADLRVNLFASAGTLAPLPMLVTRTNGEGKATLTATEPGDVSVEFVGAQPLAAVDGDAKLHIQFRVPVSAFRLEAKPAAISLVDSADLLVTLVDSAGRSLVSDEKRTVTLALESTGGEIEKETIEIPAGSSEGRTRFRPTGLGMIGISGSIDTLVNQTAEIKVSLPIGLLATSIVGGLIGGLLAWLRTRRARWTRIAIGSITGFMLYWAFLFGLVPLFPRANVLNPLTDFALSVLGGWLGTEVFTLILQKLGLVREPETAKAKEPA